MLVIVLGGHGLLTGLWRCRLWFVYTVVSVVVHNFSDYVVSKWVPLHTPLLAINPTQTLAGFLAGMMGTFVFFFQVSDNICLTPSSSPKR